MERRLAAILAADIVGYSRMMGADEDGTLRALRIMRRKIIEPAVAAGSGRVVKYLGDGFIAEFPSATATIETAQRIQMEIARLNSDVPEERRIRLRMGVNQGEIVVEEGDVYGDTVNIAARLEGLSPPEGVAVSEKVYAESAERLDLPFVDLGPQELKNIRHPVRIFCTNFVDTDEVLPRSVVSGKTFGAASLSIAVMPFRNMSGGQESDYLADGVTEEIVVSLTRFNSLFVAGRSATVAYRDKDADLREVARDLGVRYLLEGSVRVSGKRIRISAQLMDAGAGNHIWADRYDRVLEDIFDLQDEISQTIAARIQPELEHAERERSQRKPVNDLGAWDLYHRGMWHLYRFNPEDAEIARACFKQSIDAAPEFAAAYSGLAYQLCYDAWDLNARNVEETIAEAERHVRRAIALDDRDVRARFTYGRVLQLKKDYPGAIREFTTGIELSPAFAQMHHGLGFALVFSGHAEAAIPRFETAIRLSPQDPQLTSFLFARAFAFLSLKDYENAVLSAEAALVQSNAMVWANLYLTSALGHLGDPRAEAAVKQLEVNAPGISQQRFRQSLFFADCDDYLDHLIAGLHLAGVPE